MCVNPEEMITNFGRLFEDFTPRQRTGIYRFAYPRVLGKELSTVVLPQPHYSPDMLPTIFPISQTQKDTRRIKLFHSRCDKGGMAIQARDTNISQTGTASA